MEALPTEQPLLLPSESDKPIGRTHSTAHTAEVSRHPARHTGKGKSAQDRYRLSSLIAVELAIVATTTVLALHAQLGGDEIFVLHVQKARDFAH